LKRQRPAAGTKAQRQAAPGRSRGELRAHLRARLTHSQRDLAAIADCKAL
jgi:hypothetical protein